MLYSINFLRFLAALSVVLFHASFSKFNIGQAGVDVFFVISGVVISYATPSDEKTSVFLLKRITRILPLYWIATLAYALFCWAAWATAPSAHMLITSMLLLPDFSSQQWMPLYFPAWTLAFEFFFYGAFALFLMLRLPRFAVVVFMASIAGLPAIPATALSGTLNPAMCLEFAYGMVICDLIHLRLSIPKIIGFACIAVATMIFIANVEFQGSRTLAWGIPAAVLIIGFLCFEGALWMQSPIAVLLGNASYAIYIFHETVIECTVEIGRRLHFGPSDHRSLLAIAILTTLSIAVGVAGHLYVEKPLLRWTRGLVKAVGEIDGVETLRRNAGTR